MLRFDSSLTISPTVNFTALMVSGALARDHVGDAFDVGLKLRRRHHAVDQPHDARFLGIELARGVENLLGEGRTDDVDQPLEPGIAVAQTELCRRHREARIVGADAQVAAGGEAQPAADAIAADHGDGRLRKIGDAGIGRVGSWRYRRARPRAWRARCRISKCRRPTRKPCRRRRSAPRRGYRCRRQSRRGCVVVASHISSDTALCRSGLLKVTMPTPPSLRESILSV